MALNADACRQNRHRLLLLLPPEEQEHPVISGDLSLQRLEAGLRFLASDGGQVVAVREWKPSPQTSGQGQGSANSCPSLWPALEMSVSPAPTTRACAVPSYGTNTEPDAVHKNHHHLINSAGSSWIVPGPGSTERRMHTGTEDSGLGLHSPPAPQEQPGGLAPEPLRGSLLSRIRDSRGAWHRPRTSLDECFRHRRPSHPARLSRKDGGAARSLGLCPGLVCLGPGGPQSLRVAFSAGTAGQPSPVSSAPRLSVWKTLCRGGV
ncbi:uncharacterized protein LOC123465091 isoform X1 [Bubalus bubalis]|uniref:uncharacterized protein LOC123465091 isoform X1 n=1 Tax=Bubalus bubalis TaxID=89462 RepID=UPI001E1B984A|nr:uncharacterized protein LOC123465091 isoform X1 [Bubalus bubalis]